MQGLQIGSRTRRPGVQLGCTHVRLATMLVLASIAPDGESLSLLSCSMGESPCHSANFINKAAVADEQATTCKMTQS
jgi:hypothetical protein